MCDLLKWCGTPMKDDISCTEVLEKTNTITTDTQTDIPSATYEELLMNKVNN